MRLHFPLRIAGLAARRIGQVACVGLALAGFVGAGNVAHAEETASATDATKKAPPKKGPTKGPTKGTNKAAKKKKAAPATETGDGNAATASKRRRLSASPAYVVGDSNPHYIDVNAPKIVAFPHEAKAVEKAFSEGRREQLADAEKTARAARSPDRWRTVLFSLRGLHDRTDPEACFWRVLAFYRLNEIDRARAVREDCDLPGKDSSTLNAEDAASTGIPAIGTVPREDQFSLAGAKTTEKPADKAKSETAAPAAAGPDATPYTGPGPQRFQ
jgi:hypothetical protein